MAAPAHSRLRRTAPRALAPVDALVSRLRNSARLALIVVLLVVPAALANGAFWTSITGQLAFSDAERSGVVVLRPALADLAATVGPHGTVTLDALGKAVAAHPELAAQQQWQAVRTAAQALGGSDGAAARATLAAALVDRSEEHTSELQSRRDLVCRLLLEN